jgi:hypothetical protein
MNLHASTIESPNSLVLPCTSPSISKNSAPFRVLIDSGSSHSFVDPSLIKSLPTTPVPPVTLHLFDGSSANKITQSIYLLVQFPSGIQQRILFYVTPLDPSSSAVLGYDWLALHNPTIDWVKGHLSFNPRTAMSKTSGALPTISVSATSPPLPLSPSQPPSPSPSSAPPQPSHPPVPISLVGAAAFLRACHISATPVYALEIPPSASARSASATTTADLSSLPIEYHDFADVFSETKSETLAPHRPYDLRIDLEEGSSPPLGPIYSLSPPELEALRAFIDENLRSGFIRPSTSAHGAPVLFVKKKDGSLRLCVDFRGLNRILKKDRYPLPLISDLLDAPRKARLYTKIDLRHAYHLVRIAEGDEWKTAFRTRYGSFEWRVMPFGLTNAPAAFQRFMNDIFSDLLDVCVVVYLDDILIYLDDPSQHTAQVREVLRRLRKHGLYGCADKCLFGVDTVEYLGYILSPDGLTMDKTKIQAIQDWPEPRKVKDIQSFLGFANFYRRFIHNYSEIVIPLTRLTRKDTPWNFDDKCRSAFTKLKDAFISAPILTHWAPDQQLTVETDASDYAIAGILSITCPDDEIRPIAFYSRSLSPAELNYDTHDKELLAIFEAFRTWRHYLEGASLPIDVVTDHKNLVYFSTTKLLTRRQARWSEFLSAFNLVIRFRPGRLGEKPDSLTRRWDVYPKGGDSGYASINPHNLRPVFTSEQISASLQATVLIEPVLRASELLDIESIHNDIRAALPHDPLALQHQSTTSVDSHWTRSNELLLCDGRIFVPNTNNLRLRVLRLKHDHPTAGHFGQNKTLQLVRRDYYWPGLRKFVKEYCNTCVTCKRGKAV